MLNDQFSSIYETPTLPKAQPQKRNPPCKRTGGSPLQMNDRKSQTPLKSTTIVFLYFLAIVFCAVSAAFLSG